MGKILGQANSGLHSTKVTTLVRGGAFRLTVLLLLTAILIPASWAFSASSSTDTPVAPGATRLEMTQDTQINAPQESNLVFLYFYSETCPCCERQTPIINELEDEYNKSVTFVHINVQDNRKVINEFDIESIPTMILAYGKEPKEQNEYQRFEGFTDKIMLASTLAEVITGTRFEPGESAAGQSEDDGEVLGQNKEPTDNIEAKVEEKNEATGQNREPTDSIEGKVEEKNEATGQNKKPNDITSVVYTDSCSLPPLSSILHLLPPLGKNSENITQADGTLTDLLQVMICEVNGDQCTPACQFTSQKIKNGLDYIKLQNKFYHVNWNISKADAGKIFEMHFIVSGLDTGNVTYVPRKGETVPIRFYLDNHPMIRARVLREQGYSDRQIAETLVQEFSLSAGSLALVLKDSLALPALEAAQILLALDFSPVEITFAMKCAYELDAYNAGLVLKQLGFNEYTIQSMLIEVYNAYAVIVDIQSTTNNPPAQGPPGYTGLAFCRNTTRCTEPYIPGLFGHFVTPEDINAGIGGDDRFVYVKYELVSKTSDQPVVTGIKTRHWPDWNVSCPAGWTPISPLTTRAEEPCWRNGLCAQYQPFKDAEEFVTNAAISYGDYGNPATKCSAVCGSNANIWPLYTDSLDIHTDCKDEHWVYFCYNQAEAWPARPITIEVSDNEKLTLLEQYAPRVFFFPYVPAEEFYPSIPAEEFYPSSVEWSFDHLFRYSPDDIPPLNYPSFWYHLFPCHIGPEPPEPYYNYYVSPNETIGAPSNWLEYHRGCDGSATDNPCQLSDAPAYAFWNKQTVPWGGEEIEVVDLTYFFYFPYNRGKEYADTVWGNHVGDWEHITVRLGWVYEPSTGWAIKPLHLFVSAHDFGTSHPWDTIEKVQGSDHPIVYSAKGSHGLYVTAGPHRYDKIWVLFYPIFLYDYTGNGAEWNTWTNLETFDYDGEYGLGSSVWPRWMSTDYEAPCAPDNPGCDPHDPASGPIYRWGTCRFGDCSILGIDTGCIMTDGPTGPVAKGIWDDPYEP
jgi:thiol-disulfide isomerase/thioredoxin